MRQGVTYLVRRQFEEKNNGGYRRSEWESVREKKCFCSFHAASTSTAITEKSFGLYCSALICQQNESLDCATFMHYYTTLEGLLLLLKSLCQSIQFFACRFIHLSIYQKWNQKTNSIWIFRLPSVLQNGCFTII